MRGGYRQNAGRKKGFVAINAEEARRVLSEMVLKEISPIVKALISRAKKGEILATKELFDRVFGKALQSTESRLDLKVEKLEEIQKNTKTILTKW